MHEEMVLSSDLETDRHEKGPEFSEQMDPRARHRRQGEEELYYGQERMTKEPRRHRNRGRQYHLDCQHVAGYTRRTFGRVYG